MVKAGMTLGSPWAGGADGDTLLVAVREGCHFCEASAPFYKQLAEAAAKHPKTRLVAALPEAADKGRPFLEKLIGAHVEDVREADFDALKVRYTPTVLLVDHAGKVKNVWVGRLHEDQEAQVLKAAGLD
jgi:thioredoxin-related protein